MAAEGPVRHYLNVVQDENADEDRSWPQRAFSMTVGAVCRDCNNGWMSELEGRTKPFFEAVLQGRGRVLHASMQRELAAWALKTAMIVEHQQGPVRHVVPPEEYEHLYRRGEPSSRVLVWMAAYSGTMSTAVGHMYGLEVTMESDPDPGRGQRDITDRVDRRVIEGDPPISGRLLIDSDPRRRLVHRTYLPFVR
jgi:hypothetical protein